MRCGCAAVGRRSDWCAGTAASTSTAAAAAAESTRRSPYPSSHRSPYGISHVNAPSVAASDATASGGSHGDRGSVGALSDVASLAGGSAPGSALDSDVKRSKTASRKLALPPSKLGHASAGGASTHPLTAGPTPMHPPTAPQHRVGGINVPQSAIIAGFAPDSAHGGAPGGSVAAVRVAQATLSFRTLLSISSRAVGSTSTRR